MAVILNAQDMKTGANQETQYPTADEQLGYAPDVIKVPAAEVRDRLVVLGQSIVDNVNKGRFEAALAAKRERAAYVAANPALIARVEEGYKIGQAAGLGLNHRGFAAVAMISANGLETALGTTGNKFNFEDDPNSPGSYVARYGLTDSVAKDLTLAKMGKGTPTQEARLKVFNSLITSGKIMPSQLGSALVSAERQIEPGGALSSYGEQGLPLYATAFTVGMPVAKLKDTADAVLGQFNKIGQTDPAVTPEVARGYAVGVLSKLSDRDKSGALILPQDKHELYLGELKKYAGKNVAKTAGEIEAYADRVYKWAATDNTEQMLGQYVGALPESERPSQQELDKLRGARILMSKAEQGIDFTTTSPEYLEAKKTVTGATGGRRMVLDTGDTTKYKARLAASGTPVTSAAAAKVDELAPQYASLYAASKDVEELNTSKIHADVPYTYSEVILALTPGSTGKLSPEQVDNGLAIVKTYQNSLVARGIAKEDKAFTDTESLMQGLTRLKEEGAKAHSGTFDSSISAKAGMLGVGPQVALAGVEEDIDKKVEWVADKMRQARTDIYGMSGTTSRLWNTSASMQVLGARAEARTLNEVVPGTDIRLSEIPGISVAGKYNARTGSFAQATLGALGASAANAVEYLVPKTQELAYGASGETGVALREFFKGAVASGRLGVSDELKLVPGKKTAAPSDTPLLIGDVNMREQPLLAAMRVLAPGNAKEVMEKAPRVVSFYEESRGFDKSWRDAGISVSPDLVYTSAGDRQDEGSSTERMVAGMMLAGVDPQMVGTMVQLKKLDLQAERNKDLKQISLMDSARKSQALAQTYELKKGAQTINQQNADSNMLAARAKAQTAGVVVSNPVKK